MALIKSRIRLRVKAGTDDPNDDGFVEMRQPTAEEWNEFMRTGFPTLRAGRMIGENAVLARVKLFDALVTKFENLQDEEGEITLDCKERFPATYKTQAIFGGLELGTELELEKNSEGTFANT